MRIKRYPYSKIIEDERWFYPWFSYRYSDGSIARVGLMYYRPVSETVILKKYKCDDNGNPVGLIEIREGRAKPMQELKDIRMLEKDYDLLSVIKESHNVL